VPSAAASSGTTTPPYGTVPDWDNTGFRVQVGGLAIADLELDGDLDLVVGCYHSQSFPTYDDWRNFIYFNTGSGPESSPSWASTDQRSTGDIHVALVDGDVWPDVVAGNGGFSLDPSAIYFGSPAGPATTPGWLSNDNAWTNYALPFDVDHDGDLDLVTANQGNSANDPYRPLYLFVNDGGTLATTPAWQSAETSIQNFLDFADYDGDGWEDLAVSKWANFETGVHANLGGVLDPVPVWTTGDTGTDKGVGWAGKVNLYVNHRDSGGTLETVPSWTYDSPGAGTALAFGDLDGDGWPDLVVGNSGDPSVMVFYNRLAMPFTDGFETGDLSAWSRSVP
jgi:hypothetical protein